MICLAIRGNGWSISLVARNRRHARACLSVLSLSDNRDTQSGMITLAADGCTATVQIFNQKPAVAGRILTRLAAQLWEK